MQHFFLNFFLMSSLNAKGTRFFAPTFFFIITCGRKKKRALVRTGSAEGSNRAGMQGTLTM